MKKMVADILKSELDSVYCYNCEGYDLDEDHEEYYCDYCHRKSMMWGISTEFANNLADRIVDVVIENYQGEE